MTCEGLRAYSFSRTASALDLLPALKYKSDQNLNTKHCIDDDYLLGERTDIPAADAFQVSDLNLKVLELNYSNSVEPDIEEH